MKQTRALKTMLIALLALLLIFMLVACGDTDKKNNNSRRDELSDGDVELTDDMIQIIENSRDDIDAAFNYFLTSVEAGNEDVGIHIIYYGDIFGVESNVPQNVLALANGDEYCSVRYFANDSEAETFYDTNSDHDAEMLEENKIIEGETVYRKFLNSKRPSKIEKFTQEQMRFMESKLHRGAGKNEYAAVLTVDQENNEISFWATIDGDRTLFNEGFGKYEESDQAEIDSAKELMHINYTDDSYITADKQENLVKYKLHSKMGWHVEKIYDGEWNDQTQEWDNIFTGKYSADYYYCDTLPSTITIPANVGGYDIEEATIDIHDDDILESLIIEKEIFEVNLWRNIKQITISASTMLNIYDNTALEKIIFDGTTDEWYDLYDDQTSSDATRWTKVFSHYDYSTGEAVEVSINISYTVVCTNGAISYGSKS